MLRQIRLQSWQVRKNKRMETLLLKNNIDDIRHAATLIRDGEVVGIPTETVYGLGADASNEEAVAKVFAAKGRPADNPLIVHLADFSDAVKYTSSIPALAYRLAERFCPGPLTMVMPKNERIPMVTSGGLDTVGIRVPSHPVMHSIIVQSGCAIAAPSANRSGYPSPTSAEHVMRDMDGRIAAVVDGGQSEFGVESTVISFDGEDAVRILRPGAVTREMLLEVCGEVVIDPPEDERKGDYDEEWLGEGTFDRNADRRLGGDPVRRDELADGEEVEPAGEKDRELAQRQG